ncbi:Dolichyl-phosphate-mannose--protein mannosyltransferase [Tumidithrix helvetica PCC 7403]|uniref:phospholipid carrier-dependent glycosyltransferase n=1 Tax=Tumidithrix helvetica TaxID=3457545 RepID=UPI003C8D7D6D
MKLSSPRNLFVYFFEHPWLGIAAIALVAFATRFWQLDYLEKPVFDEVYYPKFGLDYLNGEPFFDAHPPLGKYMIALGIQLFGYNPFGFRCMSALAGALVPLITYTLVAQLSNRPVWAWLSGWFTAVDGLLLVESRYGLINIYILLFGMLSQVCMVLALKRSRQRWAWVLATGVMFGAAVSVKWTGLGYGVGLAAIALIVRLKYKQSLSWLQVGLGLVLLPLGFYWLQWQPHLQLNPSMDLLEQHRQIFGFHQNLGVGAKEPIHPYCSAWWTWIWLIRPVAYFYETKANGEIVEFVHGLGNPFLYWFSAIALILGSLTLVIAISPTLQACLQNFLQVLTRQKNKLVCQLSQELSQQISQQFSQCRIANFPWMAFYIVVSFLGNWLPWSLSRRCTFLYHYMPASVFAFMAISLAVEWCWQQQHDFFRAVGMTAAIGITASFVFWLPIYIGLPISSAHFRMLMWFASWT